LVYVETAAETARAEGRRLTEPASAPTVPRYGRRSLTEVVPSLLALGAAGLPNRLAVPEARSACALLVDRVGWELLGEHAADAPFLAACAGGTEPLSVGFAATTATSIASLATGRAPGEHGIVGYSFAQDEEHGLRNALSWRCHGVEQADDLVDAVPPGSLQPLPTLGERAGHAPGSRPSSRHRARSAVLADPGRPARR
jgi:hypothetical protein